MRDDARTHAVVREHMGFGTSWVGPHSVKLRSCSSLARSRTLGGPIIGVVLHSMEEAREIERGERECAGSETPRATPSPA